MSNSVTITMMRFIFCLLLKERKGFFLYFCSRNRKKWQTRFKNEFCVRLERDDVGREELLRDGLDLVGPQEPDVGLRSQAAAGKVGEDGSERMNDSVSGRSGLGNDFVGFRNRNRNGFCRKRLCERSFGFIVHVSDGGHDRLKQKKISNFYLT